MYLDLAIESSFHTYLRSRSIVAHKGVYLIILSHFPQFLIAIWCDMPWQRSQLVVAISQFLECDSVYPVHMRLLTVSKFVVHCCNGQSNMTHGV